MVCPNIFYVSLFLKSHRYNEAITTLKGTQDVAWQASALEGLATIPVLDAWSASQGVRLMPANL